MKHLMVCVLLATGLGCLFVACEMAHGTETANNANKSNDKAFNDYWYAGQAELSSFHLQQARYGEIHEGEAVLIYVTEPFSKTKHIKLDDPSSSPQDRVDVLKLNFTKTFNTGLYPYSLMSSIFTPVNTSANQSSLKLNASCQEWCGHTFTQLDLQPNGFSGLEHSYFESEGERNWELPKALLEDEVWTRIRLNPQTLPTGELKIIPSIFASRLRHQLLEVSTATATLGEHPSNPGLMQYHLRYDALDRDLTIYFNRNFPHDITGWSETYVSGWGASAKELTTTAVRKAMIKTDYWNKHGNADAGWRDKLQLDSRGH